MLESLRDMFIASTKTSFVVLFAWQSTLWLAIGLFAARVLKRQAAKAHFVLVLASAAAVVAPLLTLSVRQMDWGILPARQSDRFDQTISARTLVAATAPHGEESSPAQVPADLPQKIERRGISQSPQLPIAAPAQTQYAPDLTFWIGRSREYAPEAMACCWMLVSLVLALRLVRSLRLGRAMAAAARLETSPELAASLDAAAERIGLKSKPRLCVSPSTQCPMIWCWGPPALLLPESAAETRGVNWRSVFCHELAHLVRRDHWSALWAEVLVIALPSQPLAWRSRRRLAFLREQACDDWVLAAGGEAVDYAESLLQLVPQRSPAYALAAVTNAEVLKQRLKHVLTGLRIAPQAGRRWIAIAGVFALVGIAAVALAQQRTAAAAPKGVANETVNTQSAAQGAKAGNRPPQNAQESAGERVTVRGQVFAPDGKPAVGAEVFVFFHRYTTAVPTRLPLATTRTDAIGRYELSFHKPRVASDIVLYGNPDVWKSMTCVFARQAGYGPDAARWNEVDTTKPVNLKLVPDVPIQGHLVDLEGRPVPKATVEILGIFGCSSEELRQYLKAVQSGLWPDRVLTKTIPPDDRPPVTTDADGRFRIAGVGKDRVLRLAFRGETIAYATLTVITKDIVPMEEHVHPDMDLTETRRVVGPTFTFTTQPTRVITGVVRDARDGKPLAGVRITSDKFPGTRLSGVRTLSTKTDTEGHFRFVGMAKGSGAVIAVFADGQPYFPRTIKVPNKAGGEPISLDIDLHRGIWITGRVTDQRDGSPQLARIVYYPLRANPYAKELSEFAKQELPLGPGDDADDASGDDGRYRILGLPGPALIGAWSTSGDFRRGVGFDGLKTVKPDRDGRLWLSVFTNGGPGPSPKVTNVIKEVTLPAEPQAAVCDLTLDPGESIQISVLDASGKPATGYKVKGRSPSNRFPLPLQQSQFRLVGLAPGEKRIVLIHDAARHIGKALAIEFGPRTPRSMTVRLERCVTVVGRGVDGDGVPVGGVRLEPIVWPVVDYGAWLPGATAGADGRFRDDDVLPGVDYQLNVRRGFMPTVARKRLSVKPGEMIDLGDVKVKRPE